MKRLPVVAFFAVLALLAFVLRKWEEPAPVAPTVATAAAPAAINPACRTMRNVVADAPFMPEPNRDDTLKATALAGGDTIPLFGNNSSLLRRRYAQAFALLQKIDGEGTDALVSLPADTPYIDNLIDRQVISLSWARAMIGLFYEQGRVSRIDYRQAATFYQKSIDTRFVDDRGCPHQAQPATMTLKHLAGILAYGLGGYHDRAQARAVLLRGGEGTASAIYLLDQNALPQTYRTFLADDLDAMAEELRHPPPTQWDIMLGILGQVLLWCAMAAVLVVGAIVLVRRVRRRLGYKDEASLYRTVFFVYDRLHGLIARFGLVAEGLIGCFVGLSILLGGFAFGSGLGAFSVGASMFGLPYQFIVIFSGLAAFLGGVNKLIEAARVSGGLKNNLVHGSARPAAEPEAQAAARGAAKAPDLGNRTFSD